MERLIFAAAFLVLITSLVFVAALFISEKTELVPVMGGEYREGVLGQPTFVNPILVNGNDADRDLVRILFMSLTDLAETVKPNDSGKIWTVRLKEGSSWHDGGPVTSDDVIFTIQTIQNPDSHSPLYSVWQGVAAERVSEREIKLLLPNPYAFFRSTLSELRPIPKHLFASIPPANLRLSGYNLEPIGSGPFKYLSLEKRRDGFITDYYLMTNKGYVGKKPYLQRLVFKFYDDEDGLIRAFNSGAIDGFGLANEKSLLKIDVKHQLFEIQMPRYYAIFFNQYANPVLTDKNVRLALDYAINKREIIKKFFDNYAVIALGPLVPGMKGYAPPANKEDNFSLEKAEAVLESGGWKKGEDGIRERLLPATEEQFKISRRRELPAKLEFKLTVPEIPFLVDTANFIKEDWAKIGIKLNLVVISPDRIDEGAIKTRNYEMILFGNIFGSNQDLFSFWHSSERFYPGLNLALYENKSADALIESIRKNLNPKSRETDLTALQSLIKGDAPAAFLFSPDYFYVARDWLRGFDDKFIAGVSDRFQNIENWYIKTARVFK